MLLIGQIFVGMISALIGALLFTLIHLQIITTCCHSYCRCFLFVQIPFSILAAIAILVCASILGGRTGEFNDIFCEFGRPAIKPYYDLYIDGMMCTEYCPCTEAALNEGGYRTLSDSTLS
jgi:hypothetical protein